MIEIHSFNDECQVLTNKAGLFAPEVRLGDRVEKGELIGTLSDLRAGRPLEKIIAPIPGKILILRDHPLIYERETVAFLIKDKKKSSFWNFKE